MTGFAIKADTDEYFSVYSAVAAINKKSRSRRTSGFCFDLPFRVVGAEGVEPPTLCFQLSYAPLFCGCKYKCIFYICQKNIAKLCYNFNYGGYGFPQ